MVVQVNRKFTRFESTEVALDKGYLPVGVPISSQEGILMTSETVNHYFSLEGAMSSEGVSAFVQGGKKGAAPTGAVQFYRKVENSEEIIKPLTDGD